MVLGVSWPPESDAVMIYQFKVTLNEDLASILGLQNKYLHHCGFYFRFRIFCHDHSANNIGDDIWRYVGKLTEAQRSMLDDRFKWKVLCFISILYSILPLQQFFYLFAFAGSRDGEKEGRQARRI